MGINNILKLEEKQEIIIKLLEEFSSPTKVGKKEFIPTKDDIKDYEKELCLLSLNSLREINNKEIHTLKKKEQLTMKVSKLKKKKAMLVSIHHANNSRSHHIISKYNRFVEIDKKKYLIIPNFVRNDTLYGMPLVEFFENNPLPINFSDDRVYTTPDTELLEQAMHFEYATKLAKASEMMQKVNLAVVFSALAFITALISVVILVMIARKMGLF